MFAAPLPKKGGLPIKRLSIPCQQESIPGTIVCLSKGRAVPPQQKAGTVTLVIR